MSGPLPYVLALTFAALSVLYAWLATSPTWLAPKWLTIAAAIANGVASAAWLLVAIRGDAP